MTMHLVFQVRINPRGGGGVKPHPSSSVADAKPATKPAKPPVRPASSAARRARRRWTASDADDLSLASTSASLPPSEPFLKSCLADRVAREARRRSGCCSDERRVRFDTVSVREYDLAPGDACPSSGPPIGLSWQYDTKAPLQCDSYEALREAERLDAGFFSQRTREDLRLGPGERIHRLVLAGYDAREIHEATLAAREEAQRREESLTKLQRVGGGGCDPVRDRLAAAAEGAARLTRGVGRWSASKGRRRASV